MYNLSNTALEGKEALTTITGCEKPCESIDYNSTPLISWKIENSRDPRVKSFIDSNSSSLIAVTHVPKHTMKVLEEKPRYTAITFISDVGGICGVHSLSGIHDACVSVVGFRGILCFCVGAV